jgi:crossover junction endodeoxyribonuclease RuvC
MCPPNGCKNVERLFFLTNLFIEFLSKYDITYCCIESPAYGSEAGHLFELGEWAGIVKLELFKKGIPFMLVAPNQLKKYVSGSGQSKKQTIILDVYKNFGEEIRQDDIADAYVLARISRDYFVSYEKDVVIQFQEYQKEVLKALRKKYEEQTELL